MSRRVALALGFGLIIPVLGAGLVGVGLAEHSGSIARLAGVVGKAINLPMHLLWMITGSALGPTTAVLGFVLSICLWSLVIYAALGWRERRSGADDHGPA